MPDRCCYRQMAVSSVKNLFFLPAAALLVFLPAQAWPGEDIADVHPYSARYSLYRNGKLSGKVEIELQQQGDRFTISSEGSGTHGLARILGARDKEKVYGHLNEGRFRPDQYTRHTRVAGIDDHWSADFDWQESVVSVVHDKDEALELEMVGESLDPLSLKLEMRRRLDTEEPDLHFQMVEEDEIDEQNFRILRHEWLETSLGCLKTIPVEKIRHNSKRYTRAWHAPELANIEVKVEHGKTGGNHMEMRISELTLGDVKIVPRAGCSSKQSRGGFGPATPEPGEEE